MFDLKKFKKILVFAAHPDDETISCGGTISKLSSLGADICVIFATKGDTGIDHTNKHKNDIVNIRIREAENACKILGVQKIVHMNYSCQCLENNAATMRKVLKIIRREMPDLILTHSKNEKHKDHQALSDIIKQAAWKASEDIMPDLGDTHHSLDVWAFECVDVLNEPDYLIDITGHLDKKLSAIACYASQVNIIPGIVKHIEGLASVRGCQSGTDHAEAFKRISLCPVIIK